MLRNVLTSPGANLVRGYQQSLKSLAKSTLTYHNLLFCRAPIYSILRFAIRTYRKVGFGRLR